MKKQDPQSAPEGKDSTFDEFGLSPVIVKSLRSLGYEEPTPIQQQAIPLILDGHDIMGLAQTGTGKTAAFGLPLLEKLMSVGSKPYAKTIRALILSPTRELANQISENLKLFVRGTHLRVATVVGGQSINVQQQHLGRGNDVLVATPGRLLDLVEREAVYLDSAQFLVLDEADQMLDLGFIHALKKISKLVAKNRQTLLFSATMPKEIADLARAFLKDPIRIEVSPPGKAADKVAQSVHFVGQRAKADLLKKLLAERPDDLSLVFARTKHGAEKLKRLLEAEGFPAGSIHGNKSQGQRDRAIREFKAGEIRILVATDVAARGIDISGVTHVYNYDLPEVASNYVHRIGRTARAGADGEAIAFCSPEEAHLLDAIEKEMALKVAVASGSMSDDERRAGAKLAKEMRQGKGRRGRGAAGSAGTQGKSHGSRKGARRGTPERLKTVGKSETDNSASEPKPKRDDYAKVSAAGFTGKPNSKKNKKRFGDPAGEQTRSDRHNKAARNRHLPDANESKSENAGANVAGKENAVGKKLRPKKKHKPQNNNGDKGKSFGSGHEGRKRRPTKRKP